MKTDMTPAERLESEKPNCCDGCTDGASPLYQLTLSLKGKGWSPISREVWLCADCQHKLAFEKHFLFQT